MMKTPFEAIREIMSENLEHEKEDKKFVFDHADKFMIWIIGFAIGGISLIVANFGDLFSSFSYNVIKAILILLIISIVSGILFRWFYYIYVIQYRNAVGFLRIALSNREFMEINADDLSNESDIKEIIRRIQIDFGEDLSKVAQIHDSTTDVSVRSQLLQDMRDHHKKLGEWAKQDYELGWKTVRENYKNCIWNQGKAIR